MMKKGNLDLSKEPSKRVEDKLGILPNGAKSRSANGQIGSAKITNQINKDYKLSFLELPHGYYFVSPPNLHWFQSETC